MPYTESGRVVIDRKTYQEDHYAGSQLGKASSITDKDRLLCPPFVFGYSVSRKEWCRFYVDNIGETTWKKDAFKSLILPEKQLNIINALVSSHNFPDDARNESEQKGKGLVALLHGPPGSGKTLTAECAAEETQRALFSTSMSELNKYNEAYYFERELKKVLRLATIWKAVVLFDEADVFLEARGDKGSTTNESASRNALVAVFLRHLEYFSGIVFLTTNRIHVFDAAMKSRVHLALGYSAPDIHSRRRIWTHTFSTLPKGECGDELVASVDALAQANLNGREISNIVNTARTLARFSKVPLSRAHIENVVGVRMEFEESLVKARIEEEVAKQSSVVERGSIVARGPSEAAQEMDIE
jgi:SpoVK/Ycf46/Vps4 family AAA+-type ATPase